MPTFWAVSVCLKILCLFWVHESQSQELPETWSYPESTANGWDGLCTTGTKQSPIDLYHTDMPKPHIHSNIKFNNYFSGNSRNTFGYFKQLRGILENDGTKIQWTIGANVKKPFERCLHSPRRWCPNIRGGPFKDSEGKCAKYFLWKLAFKFGPENETYSEHRVDGREYDMELQMIHVNRKYINKDGTFEEELARNNTDFEGFAIISIFFERHDTRPWGKMSPLDLIDTEIEYGNVDDPALFKKGRRGRHGRMGTRFGRMKRSLEDSLDYLNENNHLEEWDKLTETLAVMEREKANGITKRSTKICENTSTCKHMLLAPGKFIKKATAKSFHPAYLKHYYATYMTYHGSLTTPGCEEAVTWAVFVRPLNMLSSQVQLFQGLFDDNYREATCTQCVVHQYDNDAQHLIHDDQRRFRRISKKVVKKAKLGLAKTWVRGKLVTSDRLG